MPNPNNVLLTIGGPESTPGTAVARAVVIPHTGVPGIRQTAEKALDPVILGLNMDAAEYLMAKDVKGTIPIAFRSVTGVGMLLNSLLGTEEAVQQVDACIRLMYTGSDDSCKIIADAPSDELESHIGTKGSEAGDTNFGTAGVIDLTDLSTDTVGELVTVIDGYTDYSCEKVFGDDAVDAGELLAFTSPGNTRQGKNRWVYLWFASATSGVYKHELTPDLGTTERDTYSFQADGLQDQILWDGGVVDQFSLSAALKSMVESSCEILGMGETIGQTPSVLTLADVKPMIFADGSFSLGANKYIYTRNHSIQLKNNHNTEGYGQGSFSRQYHQKGKFEVTGDWQVRLDSDAYAERAKVFNDTEIGISFYYKGGLISGVIYEMAIIEMPYCYLSDFEWVENNGTFDARIPFKAFNPSGTLYNDPLTITLLTEDSGTY